VANLSVRGVDDEAMARIKASALRRGLSVNAYLVDLIRRDAGLGSGQTRRTAHTDLDHLAGTWSDEDAAAFAATQGDFETIDEYLWRWSASASIPTRTAPSSVATPL